MSNLGDIQQVYSALQEIDALINNIQIKTETLRTEAGHAKGELREVEYIFFRLSSVLSHMGLPPEIQDAIEKIQRLILMVRILHTTLMFLEMSTPYGLVLGIISGAGAVLSGIDFAGAVTRGR